MSVSFEFFWHDQHISAWSTSKVFTPQQIVQLAAFWLSLFCSGPRLIIVTLCYFLAKMQVSTNENARSHHLCSKRCTWLIPWQEHRRRLGRSKKAANQKDLSLPARDRPDEARVNLPGSPNGQKVLVTWSGSFFAASNNPWCSSFKPSSAPL